MSKKKQIIYIIPGFGETTKKDAYRKIISYCKKYNYKVVSFNPKWNRTVATEWVNSFCDKVGNSSNTNPAIVLGFSLGAYIAVLASGKIKFNKMILCSLSPYFKEYIKKLPPLAHKILGKKRIDDFKKYGFPKKNNTSAIFMVGDKDIQLVQKCCLESYKKWKGPKKIAIIKDAEHDLNNILYLNEVKKNLTRLFGLNQRALLEQKMFFEKSNKI